VGIEGSRDYSAEDHNLDHHLNALNSSIQMDNFRGLFRVHGQMSSHSEDGNLSAQNICGGLDEERSSHTDTQTTERSSAIGICNSQNAANTIVERNYPLQSDLDPPIEGIALSAFFARFINGPRRPQTATGYLEELLHVYFQASTAHPVLRSVINALSLVLYGITHGREAVVARGRSAYDASLRMISELISSPQGKVSVDELTMSVLLSGFYEVSHVLQESRDIRSSSKLCDIKILGTATYLYQLLQ
jgi:hypothetical protein